MEADNFIKKYLPLIKPYWLPIALGGTGLMFLGYGLIPSMIQENKPEITFETASDAEKDIAKNKQSGDNKTNQQIIVDVEGAVQKPGVYTLDSDSRVQDALIAAGGMSTDADREAVAQNINLAGKVIDGAKIYIPFVGDEISYSSNKNTTLGTGQSRLININNADSSTLDTLPGIGPVTSEKIINYRPYNSIEELLEKKIVGAKVYDQIKDQITVN